jgi:hypothetical protein
MYLRHTTLRKDGKVRRYWRLVRSVRIGRRVVQQTVAHLGELDEAGRIEARALAQHLIGTPERAQLFNDGSEHRTVPVRLKGIRIERSRQFGDVYLALALWRGIGLEELCQRLLPVGQERVAWAKMAAVLVTARLCEPSSELHMDWYRRTAPECKRRSSPMVQTGVRRAASVQATLRLPEPPRSRSGTRRRCDRRPESNSAV